MDNKQVVVHSFNVVTRSASFIHKQYFSTTNSPLFNGVNRKGATYTASFYNLPTIYVTS
jgi:hypothetical protein